MARSRRQYTGVLAVGGQWLVKSPVQLWHLDALAAEYSDVLIVQTHRDPLKVIASTVALAGHLRAMECGDTSIAETAAQCARDIILGLDRAMDTRDRGVFPAGQIIDVRYVDFAADPLATIRRMYASSAVRSPPPPRPACRNSSSGTLAMAARAGTPGPTPG